MRFDSPGIVIFDPDLMSKFMHDHTCLAVCGLRNLKFACAIVFAAQLTFLVCGPHYCIDGISLQSDFEAHPGAARTTMEHAVCGYVYHSAGRLCRGPEPRAAPPNTKANSHWWDGVVAVVVDWLLL